MVLWDFTPSLSLGLPPPDLTVLLSAGTEICHIYIYTKHLYQPRIQYSLSHWKHATWQKDLVLMEQNSFRPSLFP